MERRKEGGGRDRKEGGQKGERRDGWGWWRSRGERDGRVGWTEGGREGGREGGGLVSLDHQNGRSLQVCAR